MKRKIIAVLFTLALVFSVAPISFAAPSELEKAAQYLNQLGLFAGTGTNLDGSPKFDLDLEPDRNQGITMLVALLGKSAEARNHNWETPFTDVPSWAKPSVGYAYTNKLTAGSSATTFGGSQKLTAPQYVTFVLTALGYKNGSDFVWSNPFALSDALGITRNKYTTNSRFTRGDVAYISANALTAKMKGKDSILLQDLIASGAVKDPNAGIPTPTPKPTNKPTPTPAPTSTPTSTSTPVPISTSTPPSQSNELYKITYQKCDVFTDSMGDVCCNVIIEIENTSTGNLYLDSPTYDFEDANGKLLGTCDFSAYGSADPKLIAPGEKGYFYSNGGAIKGTLTPDMDYTFVPHLPVKKSNLDIIRYQVRDLSITEGKFGPCEIVGRVTNNTSKDDGLVWVVFVLYNASNEPIGIYGTNIIDLKAGDTKSFSADSISLPKEINYKGIANYKVYAAKMQYQF